MTLSIWRGGLLAARRTVITMALSAALATAAQPARADPVLDWNLTMISTMAGQPPFTASRFAAVTELAVFEAVNAITLEYRPYLGTIVAAPGASIDAAVASAAHDVLAAFFPVKAPALAAALAATLAGVPDGQSKDEGIAVGQAAAAAMLALRANDGSSPAQVYVPSSSAPGEWQLTPSCTQGAGVFAHLGAVTPFGVPSIQSFRLGPPPALTSGEYAKDYAEVKSVGEIASAARSPDRADIARFYAVFSPVTWANSAAWQLAAVKGGTVTENARAFALLNMALSDATVATFDNKYYYHFWRPETAIRAGDADLNAKTDADLAFAPLIGTPCFPGYPSNHASLSYAAREVLERLYGPRGHDIALSTPNAPDIILHYSTLKAITSDVDDARVYGGIHFRFDQKAGGQLGTAIGAFVYKNNLMPVR